MTNHIDPRGVTLTITDSGFRFDSQGHEVEHKGWICEGEFTDCCQANVGDFFDHEGNYLGDDEDGTRPVFWCPETI